MTTTSVILPILAAFCGVSDGLQSWNYVTTGDSINGARDMRAKIELSFIPFKRADGSITHTTVTVPIEGLYWDADFKNVVYQGGGDEAPVLCAAHKWYGLKKLEKNCSLRGYLAPEVPRDADACEGRVATRYTGELTVNSYSSSF